MKHTNRSRRRSYKSFDLSREDKKLIENYIFRVGSYEQAVDFEIINKFAINHIKKTCEYGNDISKLLRLLTITNTKK